MTPRRALLTLPVALLRPTVPRPIQTSMLDELLARYVVTHPDGVTRVRYAAWKASEADLAALDSWLAGAAARRPSAMGGRRLSPTGPTSTTR